MIWLSHERQFEVKIKVFFALPSSFFVCVRTLRLCLVCILIIGRSTDFFTYLQGWLPHLQVNGTWTVWEPGTLCWKLLEWPSTLLLGIKKKKKKWRTCWRTFGWGIAVQNVWLGELALENVYFNNRFHRSKFINAFSICNLCHLMEISGIWNILGIYA